MDDTGDLVIAVNVNEREGEGGTEVRRGESRQETESQRRGGGEAEEEREKEEGAYLQEGQDPSGKNHLLMVISSMHLSACDHLSGRSPVLPSYNRARTSCPWSRQSFLILIQSLSVLPLSVSTLASSLVIASLFRHRTRLRPYSCASLEHF